MNLKKWWSVILMGGLVMALSAPSALAWNNRPSAGHNANYRGGAPHGRAYGWHGQRPAWNHGNAYGRQHHNQWNHRNAYRSNHRGSWGQHQGYGRVHNPNMGRPRTPYGPYTNAGYHTGARR